MQYEEVFIIICLLFLIYFLTKKEKFGLKEQTKADLTAGLPPYDPYRKDMGFSDVESDNYDEAIKYMGLDPAVQQSHKDFVNETDGMISTTSSHLTVKDDFTPPVPWMGLPRKAMYAVLGAGDTSRTMQTETPDQTLEYAMHHSRGYDL